jgi:hypothetical protein
MCYAPAPGASVPTTGPIEIDVRLEMGDLFPAFSMIFFRRLGWVFIPALLISIFLLITRVLGFAQSSRVSIDPITLAIPFALCLLVFLVLPYLSARSALKSSKIIQGTVHYTFSENGIDSTAQGASGHNDWSTLQKVVETRHVLLIYPAKRIMFVVPKRCFADTASLDTIREHIRTYVTGETKLRQH